MEFGIVMFATDYAIRPDDLARAIEERGFESLFFPEHTHIPTSRRSPWPGGAELPKEYWHTHELFVALAMAAAVTTRIKVGSGICLVAQRDPITLAKEVATIDALSNGRFLFGIGAGWNVEEMAHHGTNFPTRWKLLRERVEAMKVIWTRDEAEYHGDLVSFDPIWSWPKPAQKPYPPIYLGGHGPKARRRVISYCDGWIPIPLRAGNLEREVAELHEQAGQSGRDPKTIAVSVYGAPPDLTALRSYAAAGIHRAIFAVPSAATHDVLPLLDRYAEIMREFRAG